MKLSTDRILTTHVGSLPRSQAVVDQLLIKERGEKVDTATFDRVMREGVSEVVKQQVQTDIDVVSDGETSKISYATYMKDRLSGFDGDHERQCGGMPSPTRAVGGDLVEKLDGGETHRIATAPRRQHQVPHGQSDG